MKPLITTRKLSDFSALKLSDLIVTLIAMIAFMDSLVLWNDMLPGKLFTYGLKVLNLFVLAHLIQRNTLKNFMWTLLAAPIGWYVWDEKSLPGSVQYIFSALLPIWSFLLLKEKEQLRVIVLYFKIIAFLLAIGSVIYLLLNILPLPHLTYTRELDGRNYDNYFFLCFSLDHLHFRFFSIFDEPGVVGTLAAMVVFYYRAFLNRRTYITYIIAGFLSLSLFFIVVFAPILYFSNLRYIEKKERIRKALRFLLIIGTCYLAVCFTLTRLKDDPFVSLVLYNRFEWNNGFITGMVNNRDFVLQGFDGEYESFQSKGGMPFLFGNGKNSVTELFGNTSLSYRVAVYEKGVIAAGYVLLLLIIMHPWRKYSIFSMISLVFLIGLLFQRPLFFKIDYFILIYTGVKLLSKYGKTDNSPYHPQLDEGW